jgi:hypothetical protein
MKTNNGGYSENKQNNQMIRKPISKEIPSGEPWGWIKEGGREARERRTQKPNKQKSSRTLGPKQAGQARG